MENGVKGKQNANKNEKDRVLKKINYKITDNKPTLLIIMEIRRRWKKLLIFVYLFFEYTRALSVGLNHCLLSFKLKIQRNKFSFEKYECPLGI